MPLSGVFSTYVEVILNDTHVVNDDNGILHVCGGDPESLPVGRIASEYSPRMWR